jgi:16S rRNA (cytosine1402-N4)-methyltransferase
MTTNYSHIPVLLNEVIFALNIQEGKKYIDCTFGGGGYSIAIAEKGGNVLGIDVDQDAISNFDSEQNPKIKLVQGNFDNVYELAEKNNFLKAEGIVFDLGVSSYQIDTPERGFSFQKEGKLDMRMDKNLSMTAGELLDILDAKSLAELFLKFSDENHSHKIAQALVTERQVKGQLTNNVSKPVEYWQHQTTTEFANFVELVVGGRHERIHPATRVFQALRMAVNDELGSLQRGLESAYDALESGGRMAVVSFHSIEDRVVKNFMYDFADEKKGKIIGDIILPSSDEVARNPRSRSAKLRVFERK